MSDHTHFLTTRPPARTFSTFASTNMHETGRREIIGIDVGEAETEAFWREFLRSLVARA